jgi:hypothetical protein
VSTRGSEKRSGPERLTWGEIQARYPDRWVVLVEMDWTRKEGEFRTAVVLAAGNERDETLRRSEPIKSGYAEFAHRFTGRIRAPLSPLLVSFHRP